ncbi:MAG: HlyD family efflux transporter periplasmic adaptor subunit [Prolixibacteraceae bacterium]
MTQLFPPDIIKSSSENYFSEQNTTGRIIYLSVILFLILAFSLLPFVRVQVTTQSEGVVRSRYEDNQIVPVVSGEVVSCRISENQTVNKGDTLLILSSDKILQDIRLMTFRQKEENQFHSDLTKLLQGESTNLSTALYRQDYSGFYARLEEQKTKLLQAESEFILAEKLFSKGITPKHELEKITRQYQGEKNRYSLVQEEQFTLWQEKRKETIRNLEEIATRIEQLRKEKEQYCLKAPIAGTIKGYIGIREGNFIASNQSVATIAPDNDLLVECLVTPNDIGLIGPGMPVTFQFHAFNYNLWGVATGQVNEVSGNVISLNNRLFFRVRCKLDQHYLKLKNGYQGNLKKGMTLTGRFKVTERTLFQLLYDKADNWLNPKRKT